MRKLAYIFGIALFLFGCSTANLILHISYDPIDYPPQFFSPKDKRPVLYIDTVVDKREFAPELEGAGSAKGRFKEDPALILSYRYSSPLQAQAVDFRTSKTPSEIIREALDKEIQRFGIKLTKDRNLADGVLKSFIKKFSVPEVSKISFPRINSVAIIKVHLELYQRGFDDIVWEGTIKGSPSFSSQRLMPYDEGLNTALNMAIKQWYSYPGFKDALAKLVGNVTSPSSPQPPKSKNVAIATGTGFLFGSQDYIITNYHVVKGTSEVKVKFTNGESINATVVARDTQNDVAILKLTKSPSFQSREMKFGDSSMVRMGDKVFTIGYPHTRIMGFKPKYTEGVISAVTGIKDNPTVFQTTVPIQPGNSGGPLFNDKGEVVGLTTSSLSLLAIESMGAIPQSVNYAVKSSFVKNTISTIPEALLSNRGIVVVPTDSNSRSDFIEAISKNVVLILGKVD
jgi:S1-C subfamily serine protease